MKQLGKKRNIIKELLLLVLALFLLLILGIPGFFYSFIKMIVTFHWKEAMYRMAQIIRRVTVAIDEVGNVLIAEFMNDFAITKDGYLFGDSEETISSCLGRNQRDQKLRKFGIMVVTILNVFDDNHSIKSIEE